MASTEITLVVRESPSPPHVFVFFVMVDGTQVAPDRALTKEQTQSLRDANRTFGGLFGVRVAPQQSLDMQRQLGDQLFALWLGDAWDAVQKQVPPGATRTLVIASPVAAVLNLPWELLRVPGRDVAGCDPTLSIRRTPRPEPRLPDFKGTLPARPLRVLFMACAPLDEVQLDYEQEEQVLFGVLANSGRGVALDVGDMGSFEELRDRINEFQPHVVHLTGHGMVARRCPACRQLAAPDATTCPRCSTELSEAEGFFAFEDEHGNADMRSTGEITQQLFAGSGVQCAFISGCETGQAPPINALGGVCQGLIDGGLPLAVGWADSIADPIATRFAATFYKTLASRKPIDRAITQARQDIRTSCDQQGDPSWALPVLYAATTQAHVFDPDTRRPEERPQRPQVVQSPLGGMIEGYTEHFVGRRREIQRWLPALRAGTTHTLFITGIGGAGKSTLATRLARKLEADGFMPIAISSTKQQPLTTATIVERCGDAFRQAARTLRRDDPAGADELEEAAEDIVGEATPVAQRLSDIISTLNRHRFVLVLDNFEVNLNTITHAINDDAIATFLGRLVLDLVGESRLIVTSRYLPAQVQLLPPMVCEEPLRDFSYSTFLKFLLRDAEIERRYRTGELPDTLLREVHRLLGGTPRFLEQIRTYLRKIPAADLLLALRNLSMPSDAEGDTLQKLRDEYCQTIVAEELRGYLHEAEQAALSRMAVYGVAVNAEGVAAVTGVPIAHVPALLARWQQYAFVYPDTEQGNELWAGYGVLRSWLLDHERIAEDQRRHAHRAAGTFLTDLVNQKRTEELSLTWVACLSEARVQYVAAGDMEQARTVTNQLSNYLYRRGYYREMESLNKELLLHEEHPATLAMLGASQLARGQYAAARETYTRARSMYQQTDDRVGEANTLHQLATLDVNIGNYPEARDTFSQSLAIQRDIGDRAGEAATLHNLASIDLQEGKYPAARTSFSQALTIQRDIGDRKGEAITLHQLATLDLNIGNHPAARDTFSQALSIRQDIGDCRGEAAAFYQLGMLAWEMERCEGSITLVALSWLILQNIGHNNAQTASQMLSQSAGELEYSQEQFDTLIKNTSEAYTTDRAASLLRAAFEDGDDEDQPE